ncbi:MAG: hypothetical protein H2174_01470 [Vampirovibrio sp.]|jgi:hypothetical protein|nr:hypothetical protein [Vampirovibrio sp.]
MVGITPVQLQSTVVKPQAIEAISLMPKNQPRSGVTILAFSSYPNGFPVLDLDDKTAMKMVEKALPSVSVEEKRLLFGRTKWQGRTVGAVVYPISEQDIRQVQNIMNDSRLSDYERNMKVNDYMPTVMAKDTGSTRIFDIQRNKLLGLQEAEDLSKVGHVALTDAKKQAEKMTAIEGAASTQAVKEKEGGVKTTVSDEKHRKQLSDFHQQLLRVTTQSSQYNKSPVTDTLPLLPQPLKPVLWNNSSTFFLPLQSPVPPPVVVTPVNNNKTSPIPPLLPQATEVAEQPKAMNKELSVTIPSPTQSLPSTPVVKPTQPVQPTADKTTALPAVQQSSATIPIDFYSVPSF